MTVAENEIINKLDINQILQYTPHRYPFILIDKVIQFEHDDWVHARKQVTVNEPQFTGHFPGRPIMPGVLILESLAQTSGVLVLASRGETKSADNLYYFAGLDNVRFKKIVEPGDTLELHAKILKQRRGLTQFDTEALVDGEQAAKAQILLKG